LAATISRSDSALSLASLRCCFLMADADSCDEASSMTMRSSSADRSKSSISLLLIRPKALILSCNACMISCYSKRLNLIVCDDLSLSSLIFTSVRFDVPGDRDLSEVRGGRGGASLVTATEGSPFMDGGNGMTVGITFSDATEAEVAEGSIDASTSGTVGVG